jgi:transcriptional regulator with PAS, ATPase and Fis domain
MKLEGLDMNSLGNILRGLWEKVGIEHQIVGESASFLREIEKIPVIAKSNSTVLISGETGTGKELCARAIHHLSERSGFPFVPVNCGAIPVDLVENELFGHRKGAYTGAHESKDGLISEANGGTIFLDEIDCLPLSAQVKLLRFLNDKDYRQLGSTEVIRSDVRVIAASNIRLDLAVNENRFRRDLYYRLNVIPLSLPPLRERREDIPLLARHFLKKRAIEAGRDLNDFSIGAMRKLMLYDWPGNVRELENVIERAVVFAKGTSIDSADLVLAESHEDDGMESFQNAKAKVVEQFERVYIRSLLLCHEGNISRASKTAGKNRRAFWELIRKYGIDAQGFRPHHL